jgi:hypothetical protein
MSDDAMLMEAFSFSHEDLQANRAGELTEVQRKRVATVYRQFLRGITRSVGIIGAILISAAVISWVRGFLFREGVLPLSLWLYLFVILALIIGGGGYWLARDLRRGRIQVAEGMAQLKTGLYSARRLYYHAKIGGHTFDLMSATEFGVFKEGERYRVYYVRYWPDVILSVEAA